MPLEPLPIDEVLPQLVLALRTTSSVVLRAPTGAGKTTRVPPALLDAGLLGKRRVIVLEPRRVAARAAARRMALEQGWRLGEEVGYQVRFDRKWSDRTRIVVVTEGTLVGMLQADPFLDDVAAIVFDEFHERTLDTDLALGMVRRVQQTVRPDLKLIVMSATIGVEAVSRYLGDCPIVESEGRLYPVEIRYEPRGETQSLGVAVANVVRDYIIASLRETSRTAIDVKRDSVRHAERDGYITDGDILVFFPGQRDIREAARELESTAREHDLLIMPLFGELSPEQQDAALSKQAKRKIVLATNVAETSVTVDGVTTVIDTGLARQLRFDSRVGLDRLELLPISRASADQRTGRAGRQSPGVCIRMWSESAQRSRPEQTLPEIQRVDLAGAVLQLKAWGETDVLAFPWFEPPRADSVEQATALLQRLGAIDAADDVTTLGQMLAKLPLHPRLGRLLIEGARLGEARRAALTAALLSDRDPFLNTPISRSAKSNSAASQSDVLDRIEAIEEFEQSRRTETSAGRLDPTAVNFVLQTRDQLLRLFSMLEDPLTRNVSEGERSINLPIPSRREHSPPPTLRVSDPERLLIALLAAFPDRLAKRRESRRPQGRMVGGRGVKLGPQSRVTDAEYFLCLDVEGSGSEAFVRVASAVERSWLPNEMLTTSTDLVFDDSSLKVSARRRVSWEDLILEETPTALPDDDSVAKRLASAAIVYWDRARPKSDSEAGQFITRVRCLGEWLPELELPPLDDDDLQRLLPTLCIGRRAMAELESAPWIDVIRAELTSAQRYAIECEAPETIVVPSGSRIALQYEFGRSPVLAVRIQELFGLRATPRIARGRVSVLLHLLAPNYRPQQVTDDLPSFWVNAYPTIRGELRRRYPRHPWPDDPLTAIAIRK